MIDWDYIIQSADVRIPNACPELPDMPVLKPKRIRRTKCENCKQVFYANNGNEVYCFECKKIVRAKKQRQYEREKYFKLQAEEQEFFEKNKRKYTTESVRSNANKAAELGISYGEYMRRRYL